MKTRLMAMAAMVFCAAWGQAQTVAPFYAGSYTATNLSTIPGVPGSYGGIAFLNADTLLIGGAANTLQAKIYAVPVIRDGQGTITGFGAPAVHASAAGVSGGIDGGLAFGPQGVLFYTSYNDNYIGQIKRGSTGPDKLISLSPLGVASSTGALQFVPADQPGAGRLKIVSYNANRWYDAAIAPDGNGTFDIIVNPSVSVPVEGGPEGIVYVPNGSNLFDVPSILISEYLGGVVASYEVDSNGDPIPSTRRVFLSGVAGAEGAVIDPVTGDFFFSTFGAGNLIIRVSGFEPIPEPSALGLLLPLSAVLLRRR